MQAAKPRIINPALAQDAPDQDGKLAEQDKRDVDHMQHDDHVRNKAVQVHGNPQEAATIYMMLATAHLFPVIPGNRAIRRWAGESGSACNSPCTRAIGTPRRSSRGRGKAG